MILEKHLTIVEAWNELKGIENQISLYETLRAKKGNLSSAQLKDILVQGGFIGNNAILNAINSIDDYTIKLHDLYESKNAWEKYILEEIERLQWSTPHIVIGFLKEYKKMTWQEIVDYFDRIKPYSYSQIRRFYDEYKGRTPKENGM